jgi:hypothetical protein
MRSIRKPTDRDDQSISQQSTRWRLGYALAAPAGSARACDLFQHGAFHDYSRGSDHRRGKEYTWEETLALVEGYKAIYARAGYGYGRRIAFLFS